MEILKVKTKTGSTYLVEVTGKWEVGSVVIGHEGTVSQEDAKPILNHLGQTVLEEIKDAPFECGLLPQVGKRWVFDIPGAHTIRTAEVVDVALVAVIG